MNLVKFLLIVCLCTATTIPAGADPQKARKITHPSSPCTVYSTEGEHPKYLVKKDGVTIYSPNSDGIAQAVFSPSGEYVAFVGSEINWVDIRSGEGHSVVILNCDSEKLTGYTNGYPMGDFKWVTDRQFQYTDTATETLVRGKH